MKSALELYGSRVDHVKVADGVATVHLSHAYIHQSAKTPGKDPGTGWSQEARLVLFDAQVAKLPDTLPDAIADGRLEVGGIPHELIPLPFARRGRANLLLEFEAGGRLEVSGERPQVELLGKATFLETVP